jgi:hypothetical protein
MSGSGGGVTATIGRQSAYTPAAIRVRRAPPGRRCECPTLPVLCGGVSRPGTEVDRADSIGHGPFAHARSSSAMASVCGFHLPPRLCSFMLIGSPRIATGVHCHAARLARRRQRRRVLALPGSRLAAWMPSGSRPTGNRLQPARRGGMSRVFARAYAPFTLGSFLRAFTLRPCASARRGRFAVPDRSVRSVRANPAAGRPVPARGGATGRVVCVAGCR